MKLDEPQMRKIWKKALKAIPEDRIVV